MYTNEIEEVRKRLSDRDKLEALAEEASELSQAALKLIRALKLNDNVTPVDAATASRNLQEELLDVLACAHLCGYDIREVLVLSNPKWKRWAGRLRGTDHGNQ